MSTDRITDIVRTYTEQYAEELREGKMGKRGLARIIVIENSEMFDGDSAKEIDMVRDRIRYLTNTHGVKKAAEPIDVSTDADMSTLVKNAMRHMPSSASKKRPNLVLEHKRIGIMSDVHVPYHNEAAVMAGVQYFLDKDIDCLLLNGDTLDAWQISRFLKKGVRPDIFEEMTACREFLYFLRHLFPEIPIIWKSGNHDVRVEDHMWMKAPEMAKLFELHMGHAGVMNKILHFEELNIKYVNDRTLIEAGNMMIVHGHEFGESVFSPVNPARGLYLRAKYNVLAGHMHQTSEHHEGNLNGDHHVTYSTGCFCELNPSYRPFAYTKWNHGGAILDINDDKSFRVDNFRIENGQVK
jgi:predicted phosphodiesterase